MELSASRIVVAGGAGNLGRALVHALRARGAAVAVIDSDPAGAAKLNLPEVRCVAADAADEDGVRDALAAIVAELGPLTALVNCTGLIHSEPLLNLLDPESRRHRRATWDAVVRANLTATFVLSAQVAEHMALARTKGAIVNFSSVAAAGNPGQSAYAAAKAGVEALTRVWARELGPLGIRTVAIAPGFVDTPSTRASLSESALKEWVRRTPLRRLASTDEIVTAVEFALTNDFLTGRTIAIDGGLAL